jgi:toxin HigB-1
MKLATVADKRLSSLIKSNGKASIKGLTPQEAKKLWRQLSAIQAAATPQQITGMPGWNVHELTPGYPGKWAMNVTANFRLTFYFRNGEACDLDFEDYH